MAAIVVYDPLDAAVPNRVTLYLKSAHTPDFDAEPNKLVNPDLSGVAAVPRRYWKYDGVSEIVEMTVGEKEIVDPGTGVWQKWENNAAQQTLVEAWQTAFQRTALKVAGGQYKLSWSFSMRLVASGALDSKAQARFLLDGSPLGINVHDDTEWQRFSGWDFRPFTEGDTPVLTMEFQRDPTLGGNDTVEIRRIKMALQRIES